MTEVRPLRHFRYSAVALLLSCSQAAPTPEPAPAPYAPAPAAAPVAVHDPYHPPPRDTVEVPLYRGWQQYMLHCSRCHGEEATGSSFGPSLVQGMKPEGQVATRDDFMDVLVNGRTDKGMPTAAKIGIDSTHFEGLYRYLKGRSDGQLHGGRPARRES